MAKKTKKSAEIKSTDPETVAAQNPAETLDLKQESQDPAPDAASEAELDKEAEHRMQDESPAVPEDGEAEAEAQAADTFEDAVESADPHENETEDEAETEDEDETEDEAETEDEGESEDEGGDESEAEAEFTPQPRPPAKLERLQKILAQAGVASRRRGEELITQGRVQVNGKIVTELGTKADAGRDHIRVDGKLLHGAERLRYFVLNKPKGFVTTVKDPEGRPTVMQFFDKMAERLYPVGRLDYQTEGLLLVTNDGELANKLTKAASGVEKTYLVKVSGQPTEGQLEALRGGVSIEKGKAGEGRVRTAPARIRQVRQGDNPWYEVVLIEGRNRELRKMFEEIGHFVEKIRRVGYGPLVLDQEPGNMRELDPGELEALRKAADGKLRTPKAKDVRRRNAADAGQLPTVLPRPSNRPRQAQPYQDQDREASAGRSAPYPPKKSFGPAGDRDQARPFRSTRPPSEGYRSGPGRPSAAPKTFSAGLSAGRPAADRPDADKFAPGKSGPGKFGPARPAWKKDDRTTRPPARFNAAEGGEDRRGAYRGGQNTSAPGSAGRGRTSAGRSFGAKPAWNKTPGEGRPAYQRPAGPHRDAPPPTEGSEERRPSRLQIEAIEPSRPETRSSRPAHTSSAPPRVDRASFDRPRSDRAGSNRSGPNRSGPDRPRSDRPRSDSPRSDSPRSDRPSPDRPRSTGSYSERPATRRTPSDRPRFDKPRFDKPRFDRPKPEGTGAERPAAPARSGARPAGFARPPRGEGLARKFTTSSGIPRAGGARPNNKSGKPAGRSYGGRPGSGSAAGASSGTRPAGKTGWKPKPSFGGAGKPGSGGKSRPSSSGSRGAAGKKSSPRPGGKRPGPSSGKRH